MSRGGYLFDTNVLVPALVFPGGRGEAALQRIVEEKDQLLLSKPILDELLGILGRKFSRDAEALVHAAVFLTELSLCVKPRQRLRVVKGEPDNRIIECPLAGHAEVIVTGDRGLLALGEYRGSARHQPTRLPRSVMGNEEWARRTFTHHPFLFPLSDSA